MKLDTQADQWVICYAVNYCLNRQSVAPSIMKDWLIEHWAQLLPTTQGFIKRDIKEAIDGGYAGDPKIDTPMWKGLLIRLEGMTDGTK